MSLVLDSSVTLAWAFPEVTTDPVRHVFGLVAAGGAWAPGMWRLEVGNILENGVRRRRHEAAFRDALLADLAQLPIQVDTETDRHAWSATMRLAVRHRLTAMMPVTWNSPSGCAWLWRPWICLCATPLWPKALACWACKLGTTRITSMPQCTNLACGAAGSRYNSRSAISAQSALPPCQPLFRPRTLAAYSTAAP